MNKAGSELGECCIALIGSEVAQNATPPAGVVLGQGSAPTSDLLPLSSSCRSMEVIDTIEPIHSLALRCRANPFTLHKDLSIS
jgi:hypothetical protein